MPAETPDFQPPLTRWSHLWRTAVLLPVSLLLFVFAVTTDPVAGIAPPVLIGVDVVLGVAAWVAVFWRRRHPYAVALLCAVCAAVSTLAAGPALLTLASLATWRRFLPLGVVAAVTVAGTTLWSALVRDGREDWLITAGGSVMTTAVVAGWGLFLGSRRELLHTLRDRAERAEAEQELREERAREQERARIAREMHDVVAHRISQVSMRAGALAFREELPAAVVREHSELIQQTANQALDELRGVLGVLRDASGTAVVAPQPTYDQIPDLVAAHRESVELVDELDGPVPDPLGRALYRVVQEGLTNAAKHAPGAHVRVRLGGGAEAEEVRLEISNPAPVGPPTDVPGARLGLVGMAERVQLLGGRLEHGWDDGRFTLAVWLPWRP